MEVAAKAGADETYLDIAEATSALNHHGGADVVFECSGNHKVLEHGLPYLKNGGIFAAYAVPHQPYVFDLLQSPRTFIYQRIDPDVPAALDYVCDLLQKDKIPVALFLTHRWIFDQVPEAFDAVCSGDVIKGLVVIEKEQVKPCVY